MGLLEQILIYLLAAVIAVPISKRLGLGSVIGYLAAGIIIGPYCLKFITSTEDVMHFAEFGVVLLLFIIGLELKFSELWKMRKEIVGGGGLQVMLTTVVFTLVGVSFFTDWRTSLVASMGLALSSTAIGLTLLRERSLMKSPAGQSAFAVLLFQDIAVMPMLAVLPLLIPNASESGGGWLPFLKPIAAVVIVLVGGRFILRPLFRYVAGTKLREIFTAFSLLLVIGTGLLMQSVGLSMALGSFLAGVLLADSEYRHELEVDIEPFKGLLLGLFFISVGMSIPLGVIRREPIMIAGLVLLVVVGKILLLWMVGKVARLKTDENAIFSLSLSQVGEFAFVLFGVAGARSIMSSEAVGVLNVVVAASMVTTPFLMMAHERWVCGAGSRGSVKDLEAPTEQHPIILAGFGRFGQTVGRVLYSLRIPTTLLDYDPNQIELVRKFGWKTFYGDVTRLDLLQAAGADKARLLILAIDNPDAALATCELVKQHFPNLKILARARSRTDAYQFVAKNIPMIRETFGSALEMSEWVLKELGFSALEAHRIALKFKEYDLEQLRRAAQHLHDEDKLFAVAKRGQEELSKLMERDLQGLTPGTLNEGWG